MVKKSDQYPKRTKRPWWVIENERVADQKKAQRRKDEELRQLARYRQKLAAIERQEAAEREAIRQRALRREQRRQARDARCEARKAAISLQSQLVTARFLKRAELRPTKLMVKRIRDTLKDPKSIATHKAKAAALLLQWATEGVKENGTKRKTSRHHRYKRRAASDIGIR